MGKLDGQSTMFSTVVSAGGSRVVIDAGNKTLTTTRDAAFHLGYPKDHPSIGFTRLSEEHGVLTWEDGTPEPCVGDRLQVLPIHVCAWMDLQPEIYGIRGDTVVERVRVEAMRHSL